MLQRPQDPDLGDPAPLFEASEQSHTEVVRLLLEANADKDKAKHYSGATPLVAAAEFGCLEVAHLLLKDKEARDGATPLFVAALNGQLEAARLLLESNADKNKAERDGATPLFMAASARQLEVARLLLQANADKDKAKHNGATPLIAVAQNGDLEIARLFAGGQCRQGQGCA